MNNNDNILDRALTIIERAGNALPHPTTLFIYLCIIVIAVSAIASLLGVEATHPVTNETINAVSLLSVDGLHLILTKSISNFVQFAPVGSVLVAIMCIGIAEYSGLLGIALKSIVLKAPAKLLSFAVVVTGVLSSLAMDTGYVVLIPLAALMFISAGRHPLAGIAAAFAGVSGGFSANIIIGPFDAILSGISTEAATLVSPDYSVSTAANYYFLLISTFIIGVIGAMVTDKLVEPRLGNWRDKDNNSNNEAISDKDRKGLKAVALFTVLFIGLILLGVIPDNGFLRNPDNGDILSSPLIKGIVTIISFYAAVSGYIFGKVSGRFQEKNDFIKGMESAVAMMASYIVLMFFAAQFVNYFAWSKLGLIGAINGAVFLQSLQLNSAVLLLAIIIISAFVNLFIGSGSAKWALMAPIFVPMLLLVGITPEATQMAYRIGDSSTNIITPLMPYFGVVVAFAQRYDNKAGIGTIIATMLPYSIALLIAWSSLLVVWLLLGLPIGPGAALKM